MELFPQHRQLVVTAWIVGERIDARRLGLEPVLSTSPLSARVGDGLVVIFRYGVAVLFELDEEERRRFLADLAPFVTLPLEQPASDDAVVRVDPGRQDAVDPDGTLVLADTTLERLQVVAQVLARSALLTLYEREVARSLEQIEAPIEQMRSHGRFPRRARATLRQIGEVLITEMRMVGRAEVAEKPEMLWDRPDLDRLYVRLAKEYELVDRDHALARKLALLGRTHSTFLELLQNRRTHNVEWYIVILIVVEIAIVVWEMISAT